MKKLYKSIENLTQYLSQAVGRIFCPNEQAVPEIGTQPYEGNPYSKSDDLF